MQTGKPEAPRIPTSADACHPVVLFCKGLVHPHWTEGTLRLWWGHSRLAHAARPAGSTPRCSLQGRGRLCLPPPCQLWGT